MCVLKYHAFIFLIRPPRWQRVTIINLFWRTLKNFILQAAFDAAQSYILCNFYSVVILCIIKILKETRIRLYNYLYLVWMEKFEFEKSPPAPENN
jgi:hypothetical protein